MRAAAKRTIKFYLAGMAGIAGLMGCACLLSGNFSQGAGAGPVLPADASAGAGGLPDEISTLERTAAQTLSSAPDQAAAVPAAPAAKNPDGGAFPPEVSNAPAMQLQAEAGGLPLEEPAKEAAIRERFGAIRRGGKWIPTVGGGTNLVYITTGALPPGRVNEPYSVQFAAASGQPPYQWQIAAGTLPPGLALDISGRLTGIADTPASAVFRLAVADSRGAGDMAEYVLTIAPENPLEILTPILPAAAPGGYYCCQLEAAGGIPPYTWSAEGDLSTWGAFILNQITGEIFGEIDSNAPPADMPVMVWLHDAQQSVAREFTLRVRAAPDILEVPAAPIRQGQSFAYAFQAAGGLEPYTWSIAGAPPPGLWFSPDGAFAGEPSAVGAYEIAVSVQDAAGQSDAVQFILQVLPATPGRISNLTAFLSRTRVALTWDLPENSINAAARIVRSAGAPPLQPTDGVAIYYGAGTECLDENLAAGVYYYTAFLEESGLAVTGAPPPILQVRLPPDAEPFADRVADARLLHPNAFRAAELPGIVLGAPRGAGLAHGSADIVSLGAASNDDGGAAAPYGGVITLEFADNTVWNGPGADFTIFENVFYVNGAAGALDPTTRFMEPALVSVSQDGLAWHQFPADFSPRYDPATGQLNLRHPYCYHTGFAGVNPVMSNGLDPDPTDPAVSGGDSFDIGELGLDWIRFVRIQSTGNRWLADADGDLIHHPEEMNAADRGDAKAGFDLDAAASIWLDRITAD